MIDSHGISMSPEFRLAVACAMWPPSQRRSAVICEAAAKPIDWPLFLRVARRHQTIGLVQEGLRHAQVQVPPAIGRAITVEARELVLTNLTMAAEALRLQHLFNHADIPILFVKGASLAVLTFGNLALRSGQDIDIVVDRKSLSKAIALVSRAGYTRFDPPPEINDEQMRLLMPLRKDVGFVNHATGIRLELHWRLFLNPHALEEASIMAASRVVPVAGNAGLRTMSEEDLFAYLCMHGALHWWNRLKWLADINALLWRKEKNVEHLVRAAEVRGAGRAAAQALLLCRRLLGTPLPDGLILPLGKSATVRWLEATAIKALTTGQGEIEPREQRLGTTRGSFSTFLLSPGWRYRLGELRIHLTNQTDVLTVPLPRRLRFLYPLLRLPLWALRHVVKRGIIRQ